MTNIPVWEKAVLNLKEASEYSGIGINRLREITSSDRCDFVLWVGNHRHIKRKKFEEYLERSYSI